MRMFDSNLTDIIIIGILALVPISIVLVTKITDMKLKIEQIKAETAIKTEEIQARNRLEIEKLMLKNDSYKSEDEQVKNFVLSEDDGTIESASLKKKADA